MVLVLVRIPSPMPWKMNWRVVPVPLPPMVPVMESSPL
jgi:hypothetical protein